MAKDIFSQIAEYNIREAEPIPEFPAFLSGSLFSGAFCVFV